MDKMEEEKKEECLEERIKVLESQLSYYLNGDRKIGLGKRLLRVTSSIFSRSNLELGLSLAALIVSLTVAYIVLYH
tara:strand:+ start:3239 stop:3466 length:228 start_codon:yes stop_codon:yes gene_type:complete